MSSCSKHPYTHTHSMQYAHDLVMLRPVTSWTKRSVHEQEGTENEEERAREADVIPRPPSTCKRMLARRPMRQRASTSGNNRMMAVISFGRFALRLDIATQSWHQSSFMQIVEALRANVNRSGNVAALNGGAHLGCLVGKKLH